MINRQLETLKLRAKIHLWQIQKATKEEKIRRKFNPLKLCNMDGV